MCFINKINLNLNLNLKPPHCFNFFILKLTKNMERFTDVNDFSDRHVLSGESNKMLHFLISMVTSIHSMILIGDSLSPCLPSVSPIWMLALVFFYKDKNSLLGRSRREKGWQSTKQITSPCLCKLFMLLIHHASGMRHSNQAALFHVLSPCKEVVIWQSHSRTEFCYYRAISGTGLSVLHLNTKMEL